MKKTSITIYEESDYSKFDPNEFQKPIHQPTLERLRHSIKTIGYDKSKPIKVYKEGGRFVIVDGHHRFAVCKSMGLPILFFVMEAKGGYMELICPNVSKSWTTNDTATLHARRGLPNYVKLMEYVNAGIPLACAAPMLYGQGAGSGSNVKEILANGTFEVRTTKKADFIVGIIREFGELCKEVSKMHFIVAISMCYDVPEFDCEQFRHRLASNLTTIRPANNRFQMLEMIEDVYNNKSRAKVPLLFLAKTKAAERQRNFGKEAA